MKFRIFFDCKATGHHGEYFENIIAGLSAEESDRSMIICHHLLNERLTQFKRYSESKIKIKFLEISETSFIESAVNRIQRGIRELKVLERYLIESGAKSIVLMDMNIHQIALINWKHRKKNPISISGILFNHLSPSKRKTNKEKTLLGRIKRLRKKLQLFFLLRNKCIKSIFILNDRDAVDYMNCWSFSKNVFKFLIDPIPSGMREIKVPKEKPRFNKSFNFIMIGAISPRKGCLEVIKALKHSNFPEGITVSLRIMGAFSKEDPSYIKLIKSEIESLNLARSDVIIFLQNEFLDHENFCQEISHSDCVLATYIDFNGSSGMIGHACRYQKPLLVSGDGLIGNIVESEQLGLSVDASDMDSLVIAIEKMIRSDFEYSALNAKTYFENANHFEFAQNISRLS